ncbi:hypothetical protein VXJ24_04355 [Olsenella sp. YH-ols2221]|nr:hypothetical protein [Olsenella sp.]
MPACRIDSELFGSGDDGLAGIEPIGFFRFLVRKATHAGHRHLRDVSR